MEAHPLCINPNRVSLDETYLRMAENWAGRSKANRKQVGALIVKDKQIISDGYNGMPSGAKDDVCEYIELEETHDNYRHVIRTKPEVLHAESNAITKVAKHGGLGCEGATLYATMSPCFECAKLIIQVKIARVVYREIYRDTSGIALCKEYGVMVDQL